MTGDGMSVHDLLRKRLLERAGIFDTPQRPKLSLDEIYRKQWNPKFERLMRNRMAMGYFRYGLLQDQIGRHEYDNVKSIKMRLDMYEATGNLEHMVDIANLCQIEFTVNPDKPFKAADDATHAPRKRKWDRNF